MTATQPSVDGDVTSEAELRDILEEVVQSATDNGVDPRGAWVTRLADGHVDYEIQFVELDD